MLVVAPQEYVNIYPTRRTRSAGRGLTQQKEDITYIYVYIYIYIYICMYVWVRVNP